MTGSNDRLSCHCGRVSGYVRPKPASYGHRVLCHCKDCQAFLHHIGQSELLDENGGSELYQTIPGRVVIETGHDQLRCLRLSPKGLMRWYAGCCHMPLGNTLAKPGFGFVGIPTAALPNMENPGRLVAVAFGKDAPAGCNPPADRGLAGAGARIVLRHLATWIGLAPKTSEFFIDGAPIVTPTILTQEQRAVATPG